MAADSPASKPGWSAFTLSMKGRSHSAPLPVASPGRRSIPIRCCQCSALTRVLYMESSRSAPQAKVMMVEALCWGSEEPVEVHNVDDWVADRPGDQRRASHQPRQHPATVTVWNQIAAARSGRRRRTCRGSAAAPRARARARRHHGPADPASWATPSALAVNLDRLLRRHQRFLPPPHLAEPEAQVVEAPRQVRQVRVRPGCTPTACGESRPPPATAPALPPASPGCAGEGEVQRELWRRRPRHRPSAGPCTTDSIRASSHTSCPAASSAWSTAAGRSGSACAV